MTQRTGTVDGDRCHFCEEVIVRNKGKVNESYIGEIGEFWSVKLNDSVLAHPDCLPLGIDAVFSGEDPEWKMA